MRRFSRALLAAGLLFTARALFARRARRALLARLRREMPDAELATPATEWRREPDGAWRPVDGALGLSRDRLLFLDAKGDEALERRAVKRAEFVYALPGRSFPAGLLSLHLAGGDRHFRIPGDPHPWLDRLNRH